MAEITDKTYDRVAQLICEYARLSGHSNADVAHAVLASRTLQKHGYRHGQKGRLTEDQGLAAVALLQMWIEKRAHGMHQQG